MVSDIGSLSFSDIVCLVTCLPVRRPGFGDGQALTPSGKLGRRAGTPYTAVVYLYLTDTDFKRTGIQHSVKGRDDH